MRGVTDVTGHSRPRVRVTGPVRWVRVSDPGGRPVLRAELESGGDDGIMIVWFGRRHIPGIEPGRVLAVEGTMTHQRGRRTIYNPRYDLGEQAEA